MRGAPNFEDGGRGNPTSLLIPSLSGEGWTWPTGTTSNYSISRSVEVSRRWWVAQQQTGNASQNRKPRLSVTVAVPPSQIGSPNGP